MGGPGPIPWLITGELFTQAPRSAAVSLATLFNWSGALAVGLIFPVMQKEINDFSFLPFTVSLVILFLVLFFHLPETKGIPAKEIEALFQIPISINLSGQTNELRLRNNLDRGHVNHGMTEEPKNENNNFNIFHHMHWSGNLLSAEYTVSGPKHGFQN